MKSCDFSVIGPDINELPEMPARLLDLLGGRAPSPQHPAGAKGSAADDELVIPEPRAGLDFGELATLLHSINPDVPYDDWLRVMMAVHHETGGSGLGFELVRHWSAKGRKFKDIEDIRRHWNSFDAERQDIVGAAWLKKFSKQHISVNTRGRFTVIPDDKFIERAPLTWHIKGVLPRAELVVIFGASGSGKSFLVFDMVAAIATDTPWQGRRTAKARVVYIVAEGATGFLNRLKAYAKSHEGCLPGIHIIADAPILQDDDEHAQLAEKIEARGGADLIVFDTLAACSPGADENAAKDMGRVINHLKQLSKVTGATMLVIHHSGKDESRGARGWSGLRAAADAEIEISRCGQNRTATVTKMKDGEDGATFGFKLVPVEIGVDADGDPITSCIVEPEAHAPPANRRRSQPGNVERTLLELIREDPSLTGDVLVSAIIEAAISQLPPQAGRDTRRQRVRRALDSLATKGFIEIEGDVCRVL